MVLGIPVLLRFNSKTLRTPPANRDFTAQPATPASRLPLYLTAILAPLCFTSPGLADDVDLVLHTKAAPVGELVAHAEVGGLALAASHSEYLGYLNRAYRENEVDNPLIRRTQLTGETLVNLDDGVAAPLGLAVTLDQWDAGNRNLRLRGRTGLALSGLRLDHSLTMTTSFAADGGEARQGHGRLRLRTELFGGVQEGVVGYDVLPETQVTSLGIRSDWRFEDGGAVVAGLTHDPLESLSEARFGLRQKVGPFDMVSDFAADSRGTYRLGVSFSLDLDAPEETLPSSWHLSSLLAALRAEAQAPLTFQASGLDNAAD